MTTYTVYSNTNDQMCYGSSTVYADARSGTTVISGGSSSNSLTAGQTKSGATYNCYQSQMSFDTSGVPSTTPSSNPTLKLAVTLYLVTDTYRVAEHSWSSGTAAYVAGASLSGLTQFGTLSISSSGVKTFTGPSDVTRSSAYKLMIHNMDQQNNVAPTTDEFIQFRSADYTGTADDPYLTIILPTTASASVTLDATTLSATGDLEIGATAAVTLGDATVAGQAGNLARASAAVTLDNATSTVTAQGLVPITTPEGRRLLFGTSQLAGRTLTF